MLVEAYRPMNLHEFQTPSFQFRTWCLLQL